MNKCTFYFDNNRISAYPGEYIKKKWNKIYSKRVSRTTFLVLEEGKKELILKLEQMIEYMINNINSSRVLIISGLSRANMGMILSLCNQKMRILEQNNNALKSENDIAWENLAENFNSFKDFETFIFEKLATCYTYDNENMGVEKLIDILSYDELKNLLYLSQLKLERLHLLDNLPIDIENLNSENELDFYLCNCDYIDDIDLKKYLVKLGVADPEKSYYGPQLIEMLNMYYIENNANQRKLQKEKVDRD